jgi:hypothetical protein
LFDQVWRHSSFGNPVKASTSGRAVSSCSATRELVGHRLEDPVELGVYRGGVGLVVDRVQQRAHPRPAGFGSGRQEVRRIVRPAPLPGCAGQGGADGFARPRCASLVTSRIRPGRGL